MAEEAIAHRERFGAKLMAYSQWVPEHARKCADAADAAFAVGSTAGSLQGIPTSIKDLFAVSGLPTHAGFHTCDCLRTGGAPDFVRPLCRLPMSVFCGDHLQFHPKPTGSIPIHVDQAKEMWENGNGGT